MLEGEFTIEGIINKGTHILIKIPYNERKQSQNINDRWPSSYINGIP